MEHRQGELKGPGRRVCGRVDQADCGGQAGRHGQPQRPRDLQRCRPHQSDHH